MTWTFEVARSHCSYHHPAIANANVTSQGIRVEHVRYYNGRFINTTTTTTATEWSPDLLTSSVRLWVRVRAASS